ncbi:MAG: 4Fe-4S dicluster domain-containing protein [Acidobacteriota bacterium]|nr:MAG: 4Fe-4S dicluster domain-containing protein [Acidobacteriota bacterium]
MLRRKLLKMLTGALPGLTILTDPFARLLAQDEETAAQELPLYGMGIQVDRCIGCGNCMEACKAENNVPPEPTHMRTWVERYVIDSNNEVHVSLLNSRNRTSSQIDEQRNVLRTFFVPKLCNQCENPPCVQVCPVEATFKTEDGVVLVDNERCMGCGYCIQACPYGARYLHPETKTADKCTFCYHRISQGLLPACVNVCPTQARVFGNLKSPASPLTRLRRLKKINVLKPSLNTAPKVLYTDLDGEVR